jgi:hypothetical protein
MNHEPEMIHMSQQSSEGAWRLLHQPGRFRWRGWAALLVALSLTACKRAPPPPEEPTVVEPAGTSLFLELKSLAGEAVPGAVVRVRSGGQTREVKADERGQLLLDQLEGEDFMVEVQAPGFDSTLMPFKLGKEVKAGARLELRPVTTSIPFDATKGFLNESVRGVEFTVEPNALFDESGQQVRGPVEAFVTVLDLDHGELSAAPGLMKAAIPGVAEPVSLEILAVVRLHFLPAGSRCAASYLAPSGSTLCPSLVSRR